MALLYRVSVFSVIFFTLQAIEMIHNIRAELVKILEESDWMDHETQIVAKEKVSCLCSCSALTV
jgi:hypothetical protein